MPAHDPLDPSHSPDTQAGTRRVNNLPIILVGGGVVAFAVTIGVVAASRGQHPATVAKEDNNSHRSAMQMAQTFLAGRQAGVIQPTLPPKPAPVVVAVQSTPAPSPSPIQVERPDSLDTPPVPPRTQVGTMRGGQNLDEAERAIAQAKLSQFQDAVKAHSTISVQMPRSAGSVPSVAQTADNGSIQAKLSALHNRINGTATGGEDQERPDHTGMNQFDGTRDRWKLDTKTEAPPSRYTIRAGFVIPATMVSGINSELPGQIQAQVSQNVFDTATGRFLLIPQGSRLVGSYNNQIAYGQNRVLVAWQRIVFPDGKALDIGAMSGADFAGFAGLKDQVNTHFWRIFGNALLMSGIIAGVNYSQNQNSASSGGYNMNSSNVISQSLGQGLGQAMIQMFQKNMNIAPTLEIRPGFVLNVMVNKDLVFSKPYQNFDY